MESARVKCYAKINLTLAVSPPEGGYHPIDSIVTSVDMYDWVCAKRRGGGITLETYGMGSEYIPTESNNAYKAAVAFCNRFGVDGAHLVVRKNIPIGAGLGGSSADAAGALNALCKLYGVKDRAAVKILADGLGSDVKYMLDGGFAHMRGRGEVISPFESGLKLYMLLLVPRVSVSTSTCYRTFDEEGGENCPPGEGARIALQGGNLYALSAFMKNDLAPSAKKLAAEVNDCYAELESFCPAAVNMTGSGSGVYALFDSREMCEYAYSRYKGGARAYVIQSVIPPKR